MRILPSPVFELQEVHVNPRDGTEFGMPFDTYPTLDEARRAAKTELKGRRWHIVKQQLVARSAA